MSTIVDDQGILRLKKPPRKKMRSRNCFISSSSLAKDDLKLNQIVDGENTMVYALVEVSKDSEKPAKREKIPLNNKDFFQVMQKFMVLRKEKHERKFRKPSKRKHATESASVSTNFSKDEKNIQSDALALGFSDEANVIYKRSIHSSFERLKTPEKNAIRRRNQSGDESDAEHPQLKILFDRNKFVQQEAKMYQEPRIHIELKSQQEQKMQHESRVHSEPRPQQELKLQLETKTHQEPRTCQEPRIHPEPRIHQEPRTHPEPRTHAEQRIHNEPRIRPEPRTHQETRMHQEPRLHPEPRTHPEQRKHQEPRIHLEPRIYPEPRVHPEPRAHPEQRTHQEARIHPEPRMKTCPVSVGTNTEIVQTPKVLEEALEALTLNIHTETSCEKANTIEEKNISLEVYAEELCKPTTSEARNILLVPFIITNKGIVCKKPNSHESVKHEEKCQNNLEIITCKTERSQVSSVDTTQKCLTDKQSDISSTNIDQISNTTFTGTTRDRASKNEPINGENQEYKPEADTYADMTMSGGVCLLKEVKFLQKRLNAIVEGLETKAVTCFHKLHMDNDNPLLNGLDDGLTELPDNVHAEPYHITCKDCGVQAVLVASHCDKTVAVPSRSVMYKATNRLIQYPSFARIETPARASTFRRFIPYRNSPLLQTKVEYRYVRVRKTTSMVTCSKRFAEAEYLRLTNLNVNYEDSLPDDRFDEDMELEVFRKKKDEPHRSEKCTNILFRKNNEAAEEKDKMVTVKQCGKVAKIKIVGNATLSKENRDANVGKIKLEVNELGSIKISNKFNRKTTKNNVNNDRISNSTNSANCYSKTVISNVNNNVKDVDIGRKLIGSGKSEPVSRIARMETKPKKVTEMVKPAVSRLKTSATLESPQLNLKASRLRKPSTPVRIFSRGREDASLAIKPPRIHSPTVSTKPEEIQMIKSPCDTKTHNRQVNPYGSSAMKMDFTSSESHGRNLREHVEVPVRTTGEVSVEDKQTPPVKSIWVLTKVDLYEDGIQSFEILEASSHPLKYQLNKKNEDCAPIEPPAQPKINNNDYHGTDIKDKYSPSALILYKNICGGDL